jgi:alpha-beta hydrolase superfamily lysophospholipase
VWVQAPLLQLDPGTAPSSLVRAAVATLARAVPRLPLLGGATGRSYHPSRSAAEMAAERRDARIYSGRLRLGTAAVVAAVLEAAAARSARGAGLAVPLFVQHGSCDRVCAVAGAHALVAAGRCADQVCVEYEDGHHDLTRERPAIAEAVWTHAWTWLQSRAR